jgi:PAS domain S-box-containing protein
MNNVKSLKANKGKLFQKSMDALFVADAEKGVLIDCNNAAASLVGMDKSELIEQDYSILRSQTLVEDFMQELKEKKKQSSPYRCD